jgi:hypothetical protein
MAQAFQATSRIPEFNRSFPKQLRDNLEDGINIGRNGILEQLTGERGGRLYRVPGTRREYRASAPGESPAQRLGGLRNSVFTKMKSDTEGIIYSNDPVAPMLEKGTSKMRPRPFFRVGVEKRMPDIQKALGKPVGIR